jgi:hypothetical protein
MAAKKKMALRLREPGAVSLDLVGDNGRSKVAVRVRADSKAAAQCMADKVRALLADELAKPKCTRES